MATQWQCKPKINQSVTVGETFRLACGGPAVTLKREELSLRRPKAQPYALRILKVENLTDSSIDFIATSYVVSSDGTKVDGYALTDGSNLVELETFEIPVKSVITPETNPEGKPYPPYGPVAIDYPLWLWIIVALFVSVLVGWGLRVWWRARERRKFLLVIAQNTTALAPYHQFQKDLRQITRVLPLTDVEKWNVEKAESALNSLSISYQWFLAREFKVPAHRWTAREVNRQIKKDDFKLYSKVEKQTLLAEREIRRARNNLVKLSLSDFHQVLEIVRKAADIIHLHRTEESRR